jgi:hypothetical protein
MIDFSADLAEMLSSDDFGETVTKADTSTFVGVLVNEYEAQTVYGLDVDSSLPLLTCKTSDVSTLGRDDTLTIGGTTYKIHSVQPDDTGVTVLALGVD